ncbi:hypothetical protein RSOLAG1IB_04693 [Rhizoctonia solani AG-1 IB]|uniref:Uncharacterized protein n=1 Tax=Thanatephorus cucumeris (strain AG1-IB / isolate 7/3/14) TaxID=1108050 RepID=A0A0B7G0B3_THACB|nr:hypothetical protein RSOLAG1IB_04693 [Rhizoctonia solani AG-1 IB]
MSHSPTTILSPPPNITLLLWYNPNKSTHPRSTYITPQSVRPPISSRFNRSPPVFRALPPGTQFVNDAETKKLDLVDNMCNIVHISRLKEVRHYGSGERRPCLVLWRS